MSKQKGNKNWTTKEIEIVEENAGFIPPTKIVQVLNKHGFYRTEIAIKNYCITHNISFACQYDNISLRKLAKILGVSSSTSSYWYKSGQLPTYKYKSRQMMVRFKDVQNFLKSRTFKTNFNKEGINFFLGE
jgi:transposase